MTDRLPVEDRMTEALAAYPPQARSLMLEVLTIRDDFERARRIGDLYADERSRGFAEAPFEAEEDPARLQFGLPDTGGGWPCERYPSLLLVRHLRQRHCDHRAVSQGHQ